MEIFETVLYIILIALAINLPMGFWRKSVKKFSLSWFLAVHISVPLIYGLRVWSGLSYKFIPLLIVAALAGQFLGGDMEDIP